MEDAILSQCLRYGREVPKVIQDAPELMPGLDFYYDAFSQLNTSRVMGGPISVNSIFEFGKLNEYTKEEILDLQFHVHRLDTVYMEHEAKKS